jgi:type IV pilus assembly protein PilC
MASTYYYVARTTDGERVAGSMLADRADAVVAHLRSRALFVITVVTGGSVEGRFERLRSFAPASRTALVAFFRSLATMVAAGVPLHRSLSVTIAQCADGRLAEALRAVRSDLEAGMSLAAAMRRHPAIFSDLYVATVEAGESGGVLDDVLERLAGLAARDRAFRNKVGSALTYPLVVLAAASLLTFFLVATIVPTFARMFEQLGAPLPLPTRVLLWVGSHASSRDGLLLVGALFSAVAAAIVLLRRSRSARGAFERFRLIIPVSGNIERKTVVARISRMLSSLLRCGVDLLRAIDIVAPVSGNSAYTRALRELGVALREGTSIAEPLQNSPLFDPLVVQMVRVGEETGALDAMLLRVAEHYEGDVEVAVATLGATIEPVLIGGVGLVVGAIVFAIFVPLYTMIGHIR